MAHQGQRGVGRVEHGATARPGSVGEVDDEPNILLQQRPGHAGEPVQAADPAKSVEREAVPTTAGDDLSETVRVDAEGARPATGRSPRCARLAVNSRLLSSLVV